MVSEHCQGILPRENAQGVTPQPFVKTSKRSKKKKKKDKVLKHAKDYFKRLRVSSGLFSQTFGPLRSLKVRFLSSRLLAGDKDRDEIILWKSTVVDCVVFV